MNSLRWTIGIITTLATVGWVALVVAGSGFRRSFGASENSPLMSLAAAVAGMLIVSSVIWPERRLLLHVTAVVMLGLAGACIYLARETMFVATIGLAYVAMWFAYYYRTIWR